MGRGGRVGERGEASVGEGEVLRVGMGCSKNCVVVHRRALSNCKRWRAGPARLLPIGLSCDHSSIASPSFQSGEANSEILTSQNASKLFLSMTRLHVSSSLTCRHVPMCHTSTSRISLRVLYIARQACTRADGRVLIPTIHS